MLVHVPPGPRQPCRRASAACTAACLPAATFQSARLKPMPAIKRMPPMSQPQVGLLKASARRSRPVYNQQSDFTVVVAVDHFSFPSGHSSRRVVGCGRLAAGQGMHLLDGVPAKAVSLSGLTQPVVNLSTANCNTPPPAGCRLWHCLRWRCWAAAGHGSAAAWRPGRWRWHSAALSWGEHAAAAALDARSWRASQAFLATQGFSPG